MFVLLVLSVMIITGTVLVVQLGEFYAQKFSDDMNSVFSDGDIVKNFSEAADESEAAILEIIDVYAGAGRLGINKNRNFYIFDSKGVYLNGSSEGSDISDLKSANFICALDGKVGDRVEKYGSFMDFAYPVLNKSGELSYIVYINDTKEEVRGVLESIFVIIFQALLWGVAISLVLGYFISKTITSPIVSLTKSAERLAAGDMTESETNLKKSDDEIGILAQTFTFMSNELYRTMKQIEGEKTKLETVLENLTDGVIAFDTDGKVIHINPVAMKMLSIFNKSAVKFDVIFDDIGADIKMGDVLYLKKAKRQERTIFFNAQTLRASFAAFKNEEGKKSGVVVAIQDITEQQRLENSRREFVANVSHELRTPLTTIKSYTETILEGRDDDSTETHFLSVISSEVDRMTRLVADLLTLSKLDHGKDVLKTETIDVYPFIERIVEKMKINAENNNISLSFSKTTELPEIVGDRDQLERVIINIVSNSIKYTPEGGRVEVFAGSLYNDVYIKVKDTGIGIPKKDLDRIFERFYRVDKARTRKAGGTGLGLAIAKEIVDAHGGRIKISSEPNEGTEVMVTLPAKKEEKK